MSNSKEDQSRNTWINKDEPTYVSSMAVYKDGYSDIMEPRRGTSDLKYAIKPRIDVPQYKYNHPRSAIELKQHVLESDRVKYAVEQIASTQQIPTSEVFKEAKSILDELGHSFGIGKVRCFAYVLIKVFKSLFERIYVNDEGIQRLRKLVQEYPVLLMPTHRSYMDFLLVSYIFYEYDMPLPIIAAAMDFKSMKFVGTLLRCCGAFYIRRSFGSDTLYWAIFTEYVQTQLRNGDAPLEFFVEGTRSRTMKSYQPRIGMLAASLESYFKAELPDVMIVPISISYERILEESLYAYELLGIPKPKESTSGLLKARSILSENFGSVHMFIGQEISIRQFSTGKIDRVVHSLEPRYINNLTKEEAELTRHLAFEIVREHQKHMVISPWALMASVLMQSREGISVKQLVRETEWLKRQAVNLGAYVDWPGNASPENVVHHYLSLHPNIISISEQHIVEMKVVKPSHVRKQVQDEVMLNAATNLIMASYRNQLLHVLIRPGIVALCVNGCCQDYMSIDELYSRYKYLENLFSQDFVFQPGHTKQDFEAALLNLEHSGGLTIQDNEIVVKKSINKHTTFLSHMFEPFLLGYWVLCQHLLTLPSDTHGRPLAKKPKLIAKDAQQLAVRLIQDGAIKHLEILSLDILGNGLNALTALNAMHKNKRQDEPWLSPNSVIVSEIAKEIGKYIDVPTVSISQYVVKGKPVLISSKL